MCACWGAATAMAARRGGAPVLSTAVEDCAPVRRQLFYLVNTLAVLFRRVIERETGQVRPRDLYHSVCVCVCV
jgi:hypothetical protein